jgi:hypothetical protein
LQVPHAPTIAIRWRDDLPVKGRAYPHDARYDVEVYAQKLRVEIVIRGERRACPLEWLDQFCMRNFTNAVEFDDTLPLGDGILETSFRVTPERFAESLGAWLNQRGKGEGQVLRVDVATTN